jgi:hypothetical protein
VLKLYKKKYSFFTGNKLNRKIFFYLIFVLIASVLWFLNALDKNYNTTIPCEIEFYNLPKDQLLISDIPKEIIFKVDGQGFALMKYYFGAEPDPIRLDYNVIRSKLHTKNNSFYLLTEDIRKYYSPDLGEDISLVAIDPDTIHFSFAKLETKKVPVELNIDYKLDLQYEMDGAVEIDPDSILISGPISIIDGIDKVQTTYHNLGLINEDVEKQLNLNPIDKVTFHEKSIDISIPVFRYAEKVIYLPIPKIKVPGNEKLVTNPLEAKITYFVDVQYEDEVDEEDFRIEPIDYGKAMESRNKKVMLKVNTENLSEHVISWSLDTKYVRCFATPIN